MVRRQSRRLWAALHRGNRFAPTLAPFGVLVIATLAFAGLHLFSARGLARHAPNEPGSTHATTEVAPRTASAPPSASPAALSVALSMPAANAAALSPRNGCGHGDARRTHQAAGVGPSKAELIWRVSGLGALASQPVASPDEKTLYVATLQGFLLALSPSGTVLRRTELGARAYGAPCIAEDGTAFVGSDAGRFFAIAKDGSVRWRLEVEGEADSSGVFLPDGALAFAAGNSLYTVSHTGTLRSRFKTRGKIFAAPALHPQGFAVIGSQDHRVYAVDARGDARWSTDLGADVDGAPVVAGDGNIFVGTDAGYVIKLAPDGRVLLRVSLGGFVRGPLSVTRNGDIVVGVYGPRTRLVRIDGATGAIVWTFAVPGTGAREFGVHGGALEDALGRLYFGAQDDRIYALTAEGSLIWSFLTAGDVDAPVTLLSDGRLIVASDDGTVYGFGNASENASTPHL
jgi:outer membrane protein assembly factor BamB